MIDVKLNGSLGTGLCIQPKNHYLSPCAQQKTSKK
jgi:hypothetical protein